MIMRTRAGIWREAFLAAALFALAALILWGTRFPGSEKYAEISFTDFASAELHGLSYEADGSLMLLEDGGYLEIPDIGRYLRGTEIRVSRLDVVDPDAFHYMQIYYDVGEGCYEVNSVKVRLAEGDIRAGLALPEKVQKIRIRFYGTPADRVRLSRITFNPDRSGNRVFLILTDACVFLLVLLFLPRGGRKRSAGFALFSFAALVAAGIPVQEYGGEAIRIPFLILLALSLALSAALFYMKESRTKERTFTLLLMALAFTVYLLWSLITPFGDGPDEAMHYDIVKFIRTYGSLPRGDDERIRNGIWGFSYAFSPILPFILGAGISRILSLFTSEPFILLMGARMVSILSGVGTVCLVSKIAARAFPGKTARYTFPVFVGLFPELAFLFTYVNSDGLAIFTTAMVVYAWQKGAEENWTWPDGAFLAVSMGLLALTYYNCYGFILTSIPLFFGTIIGSGRSRKYIRKLTGLIVLLTLGVCLWWFIRNGILYGGDILGRRTLNETAELYASDGYRPSEIVTPAKEGLSVAYMLTGMQWIRKTYESFIAMFSHYVLPGRVILFRIYKRFFAAAAVGDAASLIWFIRQRRRGDPKRRERNQIVFCFCMAVSAVIPVCLAAWYSYASDFQPQGRYLMPCIIPLGFFVTVGFDTLDGIIGKIRKKRSDLFCGASMLLSLTVILNVFLDTVFPFYR